LSAAADVNRRDPRSLESLKLIHACALQPDDPIIDVSGGAPFLVEALLYAGFTDLTVINSSPESLDALSGRLGDRAGHVTFMRADLIGFHAHRRYALWHDRGIFHLLTHPEERQQYVESLEEALRPSGHLVITTFGPDGPQHYGGRPVRRYSARTLAEELGGHFELAEHSLEVHPTPGGQIQQYLHCRFRKQAPHRAG
jgi:hypothetical protein